MPGKEPRVLCPVCQEPIPPEETECENCGAFVIDEAVVRLSRALGLDRNRALKLFEAGFRHPTQLANRDPNGVLEKGEVGLLYICTNCGGFVGGNDAKCPRCAAELEAEPEVSTPEEPDILDLVLCPSCGAESEPELAECEICREPLRQPSAPATIMATTPSNVASVPPGPAIERPLEKADDSPKEPEASVPEVAQPTGEQPTVQPSLLPSAPVAPAQVLQPENRPALATQEPPPFSRPPPAPPVTPEPTPPRPVTPATSSIAIPEIAHKVSRRTLPKRPVIRAVPAKRVPSGMGARTPRKRARPAAARSGLSPETTGGLVLGAAAGLLLAGAFAPVVPSAVLAIVLLAFAAHGSVSSRRKGARPSAFDVTILGAGALVGLSVPLLGRSAPLTGVVLAFASALALAWTTGRFLRGPRRSLIAVGSAVPMIGQALATAADPAYAMTTPWIAGILAAMPWPAALAAMKPASRKATTVPRQSLPAEQGGNRKPLERSLAEYQRAIASARKDVPGVDILWHRKGATLILLGRYEEALRAVDTALNINPRNAIAWVTRGRTLTKLGRPEAALRCFTAAIKMTPSSEIAWNNAGNSLARLGKFVEALRCYRRALDINSRYRGAWANMGYLLNKLGRFEEANSCADQVLRLDAGCRAEPT